MVDIQAYWNEVRDSSTFSRRVFGDKRVYGDNYVEALKDVEATHAYALFNEAKLVALATLLVRENPAAQGFLDNQAKLLSDSLPKFAGKPSMQPHIKPDEAAPLVESYIQECRKIAGRHINAYASRTVTPETNVAHPADISQSPEMRSPVWETQAF